MDNASYHSRVVNKIPTMSTKKSEIIDFMKSNKVTVPDSVTKTKLLKIINENREVII